MIIDITRPVYPGMPVYPGDPEVTFEKVSDIASGGAEIHRVTFGTHTGTHIDAPSHMIAGGRAIDSIDLDSFIGRARLYRFDDIKKERMPLIKKNKRLLLKTGFDNSGYGTKEYPSLTPDMARLLAAGNISLLGTDAPSVDPPGVDLCHKILLEAGIVIVENLNLGGVSSGKYYLYCLPVLLMGLDGSPARVLLKRL